MFRFTSAPCIVGMISLTLLATPDALAVDPAKKATQEFKADLKAARKDFATAITLLNKQLDATLDLIDVDIEDNSYFITQTADIFDAVKVFQNGLGDALDNCGANLFFARAAAQSTFDGAGIGQSDVPRGFVFGDGGMTDEYYDDVHEATRKAIAAAEVRVRKTGSKLAKHTDLTLEICLAPPKNLIIYPGSAGATFTALQHTIAILMSVSQHDGSNQTRLYCFGNCYSTDTLTLDSDSNPGTNLSTTVTISGSGWSKVYLDVPHGDYVFKLNHAGKIGGGAYAAIGVR